MIDVQLKSIQLDHKPYPIGVALNVFEAGFYQRLLANWPPASLFEHKPELGEKYSLSTLNNAANYYKFIENNDAWSAVFNILNSASFFIRFLAY